MTVLAIVYLVTFVVHACLYATTNCVGNVGNAVLAICMTVVGISLSITTLINA